MKKLYTLSAITMLSMMTSLNGFAQLSGMYTIGGASPDYATITAAVTDLTTQGVSGAVVFNIRAGTYTEQVSIPQITGASAANTITFQSQTGDSTSVVISSAGTVSATSNYTVQLTGADYLVFSHLTLERTGTQTHSVVMEIGNTATHNLFTRNVFQNSIYSGALATNALVNDLSNSSDSANTFLENRFEGGTFALYLLGSTSLEEGNVVTGNIFSHQTTDNIEATNQTGIQITKNSVMDTSTVFQVGFYLFSCSGNSQIEQNKIELLAGGTGVSMTQCIGSGQGEFICGNNFIHISGGTQAYGIRSSQCSFLGIYFNSVNNTSPLFSSNSCLDMSGAGAQNKVLNNILVNVDFYCVSTAPGVIAQMDHNDLLGGPFDFAYYNGAVQANLSVWRSATGFDSNSVSANPLFTSASDLHVGSFSLNNAGVPAGNISVDIDDQPRNVTTPDIGADEINPPSIDLGVSKIYSPLFGSCGSTHSIFAAIIKNYGAVAQSGIPVTMVVSGTLNTSLTDTLLDTVAVYGSDTLYFSSPQNTVSGDTLRIVCYTTMPGDLDMTNDTLVVDTVIINSIPGPPSVPASVSLCAGDSASINATFPVNFDVYWYSASQGGFPIGRSNPLRVAPSASTTYYAEIRDTSLMGGTGCIKITECELNDISPGNIGDYLEIQNCSNVPVDASGLAVLVSNDYTNMNSVNTTRWQLGSFAPGEIRVKHDVGTVGDPDYWGQNILWNGGPSEGGWVMIIDTINAVVIDFVCWEWTPAQIAGFSVTAGGNTFTAASCWNGASFISCITGNGSISRRGGLDHDDATDWICANETYDTVNTVLNVPFTSCGGGGCPSDRVPVTVNVNTPPVIYLGNDTAIHAGQSLMLTPGSGFAAYTWSTGASTAAITVTQSGDYWVSVTDANGCTDADTIHVNVIAGIDEATLNNSISVYPNPANDVVTVNINFATLKGNISIRLFDELGNSALAQPIIADPNHGQCNINLSSLSKGVYYLEFIGEQGTVKKRIVKM